MLNTSKYVKRDKRNSKTPDLFTPVASLFRCIELIISGDKLSALPYKRRKISLSPKQAIRSPFYSRQGRLPDRYR